MGDKLFDWLYGVIASPVATLNEIAIERPVGWALLVYIGVAVLTAIAAIFEPGTMADVEEFMTMFPFYVPLSILFVAGLFFTVVMLLILSFVLHLFARLFGGSGGYWNFFSAYTFANFPTIFNVPLSLIASVLGGFGSFLSGLFGFGISIWILVLQVLAVRESHGLTTGISILAYFISFLIIVAIPVVIVVAVVLAMIAG